MKPSWNVLAGLTLVALLGVTLVQADGQHAAADAPVSAGAPPETITVNGAGSTTLTPDEAVVDLGVTAQARDARSALADNGQAMSAVVAAIRQSGVANQDIRTTDLNVSPMYASGPGANEQITGFQATNLVEVTLHDTSKVGPVVDASLHAGANQVQGIRFMVSDATKARRQAYQDAVADAQGSAASIAAAGHLTIVGIQSVSEAAATPPTRVFAAAAGAAAQSTPVFSGQQTVDVQLQVVFDVTR